MDKEWEKEKPVTSSRPEAEVAQGRNDKRKEVGIQKTSEGQGVRKWDTEKKRGMGRRTLG